MSRRASGVALAVVLAWIAWAGLGPFEFRPENRVDWLGERPGLRFEGLGLALSDDEIAWDTATTPARLELELALRSGPAPRDAKAQHAFFVLADEFREPALVVYQTGADLVVADRVTNPDGERWYNDFRLPDALPPDTSLRLRVVDDGEGPRIFLDEQPAEPSEGYAIPIGKIGERLRGRIVLGTHPDGGTPWTGELHALALRDGERTLARYSFADGPGADVENEAGPGLGLALPEHFRSLRPPLGLGRGNAFDVAKNLIGFVPFGFLLARLLGDRRRVVLVTSLTGCALSLGIELTQTLMVGRVSSIEDLVLNTLGALAGALLARHATRDQKASQAL